jgi:SAM-dependent methyltransferase
LARQGYRVVGTDYSPTAIAMAQANARKSKIPKSKIQNLKFLRQDALHPKLRPASFELIVSLFVLHCFIGKDRLVYWRNARKLLKKGGLVALTSMVDLPNNPKLLRQLKINQRTRVDLNRTRCFASEEKILAEAKAAGLEVLFHARQKDPDGSDGLTVIARKN